MNKKNNLILLLVSSIICLLPIVLSLAVYKDLPEQVAMQWNLEGDPNWYAHKSIAAFGMPLFFLLIHIVVIIALNKDPKRANQSKAIRLFAIWISPILSLTIVPILLFSALGFDIPILIIIMVLVGIFFIFLGNYMNKNKQNYTAGIRIPWTLNDPDNWNKTHRMAGFLWVIGGIIFIIVPFLPLDSSFQLIIIFSIIALLTLMPIFYSYSLYKKGNK